MKLPRERPRWALAILAAVLVVGVAYTAKVIDAQPDASEIGAGPQVEGRLMDIIIGEESGTTFCEFDARVQVTRDGIVVAKISRAAGGGISDTEGLPVEPGERVQGYKPIDESYSTTLVYRDKDGKLYEGCARESVRVTPAPFEGQPPSAGE